MFAWELGWTGVNGMQLQPRVQPLKPDHDLAGIPEHRVDGKVCDCIGQTLYNVIFTITDDESFVAVNETKRKSGHHLLIRLLRSVLT
jgi:hypothetical protein